MKENFFAVVCLLIVFLFISCTSQDSNVYIAVPEENFFTYEETIGLDTGNIIETKEGADSLPYWLEAFLYGGIESVESSRQFQDKYAFIGIHEGANFFTLARWADNFSAVLDLPMLAAARIEKNLIKSASLYPDDEYGRFFERLVKNAYNADYPGAVKEDTYWIKINTGEPQDASEAYMFFVLISIDRQIMQNLINEMITQTLHSVTPTRSQTSSINNMRQSFFEGF